jgi:superfamily II DNA/RNA helicase
MNLMRHQHFKHLIKLLKKKLNRLQVKMQLVRKSISFFIRFKYKNKIETAKKLWADLHVSENIIRSLVEQNFLDPTPIQRLTLPAAIRDHFDIIGAAETVTSFPFSYKKNSFFSHKN